MTKTPFKDRNESMFIFLETFYAQMANAPYAECQVNEIS